MASSSNKKNPNPLDNGFDPKSDPNTTFVQADPSTFRAVVQRLTGVAPGKPNAGEMGPRRPAFKLHERRQTARNLEIEISGGVAGMAARNVPASDAVMFSPVSPLEYMTAARGSPKTPMEKEERAIAEKGFYLHPSPLTTPRGSDPPELLPLFPLCSRGDN